MIRSSIAQRYVLRHLNNSLFQVPGSNPVEGQGDDDEKSDDDEKGE